MPSEVSSASSILTAPIGRLPRRRALAIRVVAVTLSLGAAAAITGCPGHLENPDRFDITGSTGTGTTDGASAGGGGVSTSASGGNTCPDVPKLFVMRCGTAGCHGGDAPVQGLDLASPNLASRVVGAMAKQCAEPLADPMNPEGSVLYKKLKPSPTCGPSQMPIGAMLSTAEVACVKAWIAAQM
jgi:hypothetical protein